MTDTSTDLVSIVIPTYFRNDELREAIESCRRQDYEQLEIIVIDDSGKGYAQPVVSEYEDVEYIPLSENKGAHAARNIGIEQTSGRYIQLLDDDDQLLENKLSKQIQVFHENDDVGVVYCGLIWEGGPTIMPDPRVQGEVLRFALMFQTSPCAMGTMLIKREVIEEILPFKHQHGADDIGMKIELARITEFDYVDEPLLLRGASEESLGSSMAAVEGRHKIINVYDDLYDTFPDRVRRSALGETYLVEGQLHLKEKAWSLAAIVAFGRACYHIPGTPLPYVGSFLSAFFGRFAHKKIRDLYSRYRLGNERQGKST